MNIIKNRTDDKLVVALEGRLDTMTAPELENDLKPALDGVKELTFDMAKLDYISSAGIRIILAFQKIMSKQGSMKIINANEMVMEIFEVTGFSEVLKIE